MVQEVVGSSPIFHPKSEVSNDFAFFVINLFVDRFTFVPDQKDQVQKLRSKSKPVGYTTNF